MGDENQWLYFQRYVLPVEGAILEVGSGNPGKSAIPFRTRLNYADYVGLDLEAGPGVEVVGNLSQGLCGLPVKHFALVICCSVLEHVQRPWLMAQNIMHVMKPGGRCYMAVPWVWRYHPYPADYWRFSWQGIETLFESLTWASTMYSSGPGEFFPAHPGADSEHAIMVKSATTRRKYLPYLQLHMLGRKS